MEKVEPQSIISSLPEIGGGIKEILPQDVAKIIETTKNSEDEVKYHLIDVRSQSEFNDIHAMDALLIPLEKFSIDLLKKHGIKEKDHIFVICRSGARSAMACGSVINSDWKNLYNVKGGTNLWALAGLKTEKVY